MTKYALIKHSGAGIYIFKVRESLNLFAGDLVQCDTRRGTVMGMCVCDSFHADCDVSKKLMESFGVTESVMRYISRRADNSDRQTVPDVAISEQTITLNDIL